MEFAKIPVAPRFVIASPFVIADSIRNPVHAWHWIPDVETPDLIRGRDDKGRVQDDKGRVRNDKGRVQDDNGISIFSNSLST